MGVCFQEAIPNSPQKGNLMISTEVKQITVNGMAITDKQINEEVQYHPAKALSEAQERAAHALVVRELLLQEAQNKGFLKVRCTTAEEQAAIDVLLESEVKVPNPDPESCTRYYKSNKQRFITSPLFEVSHILFPAPVEDKNSQAQAKKGAEAILSLLQKNPGRFDVLARENSLCSSAKDGGRLGQISKGQTTPEFEEAVFKMKKDEISKAPVATRYGYHIICVHERAESNQLPFDAVQEWIADYLKQSVWQRAVSQYIGILAGKADIKGFRLKAADSPLVQ